MNSLVSKKSLAGRLAFSIILNSVILTMSLGIVFGNSVSAQNAQQPAKKQTPVPQKKKKAGEITILPPEVLTLSTKDNVNMVCTFFAAPQNEDEATGKNAIPFILIHDWEGSRTDLEPLGTYLQSLGNAVIIPDLRGHGDSTTVTGVTKPISHSKFRKTEVGSAMLDIERCKKYLVQRNNEGQLNIDLLSVVAVGHTSALAAAWTIKDWAFENQGSIKQGKDVKSLTFISPRKSLKGIPLNPSLKNPLLSGRSGQNLPTLVVWSANDDGAKDSQAAVDLMKKGRPDPLKIDEDKRARMTTLFEHAVPRSKLTATELIKIDQKVWLRIARFVAFKVGAHRDDLRWSSRERK